MELSENIMNSQKKESVSGLDPGKKTCKSFIFLFSFFFFCFHFSVGIFPGESVPQKQQNKVKAKTIKTKTGRGILSQATISKKKNKARVASRDARGGSEYHKKKGRKKSRRRTSIE